MCGREKERARAREREKEKERKSFGKTQSRADCYTLANPPPLPKASCVAVALWVCCSTFVVSLCPAKVTVDSGGTPVLPVAAAVVVMVTPGAVVSFPGPLVDLGVVGVGLGVVLGSVLMVVCTGGTVGGVVGGCVGACVSGFVVGIVVVARQT